LRLRQISGLQILTQLLKALFDLLRFVLRSEGSKLRKKAAGDGDSGHVVLPFRASGKLQSLELAGERKGKTAAIESLRGLL
jgi:hypothetical protein